MIRSNEERVLFTNENDSLRRSEGKKDSDDVIEKAGVVFKDLDTAKVVNFVVDAITDSDTVVTRIFVAVVVVAVVVVVVVVSMSVAISG